MANWVSVGRTDDFPAGSSREVLANDRIVAVYCVEGAYYALDGICPHQGGPLGQGCLQGHVVTCPWHGWQYDVRSGQHQSIKSLVHRAFATKVEDGELFVDLEA